MRNFLALVLLNQFVDLHFLLLLSLILFFFCFSLDWRRSLHDGLRNLFAILSSRRRLLFKIIDGFLDNFVLGLGLGSWCTSDRLFVILT